MTYFVKQFKGEGDGGMPGFIAQLPADDVVWGVFKVVGCDDRGNLVSRRPKYIFVKYLPAAAPTMKRARAGGHKGAIKQIVDAHIDIEVCILSCIILQVLMESSCRVRLNCPQIWQRRWSSRSCVPPAELTNPPVMNLATIVLEVPLPLPLPKFMLASAQTLWIIDCRDLFWCSHVVIPKYWM